MALGKGLSGHRAGTACTGEDGRRAQVAHRCDSGTHEALSPSQRLIVPCVSIQQTHHNHNFNCRGRLRFHSSYEIKTQGRVGPAQSDNRRYRGYPTEMEVLPSLADGTRPEIWIASRTCPEKQLRGVRNKMLRALVVTCLCLVAFGSRARGSTSCQQTTQGQLCTSQVNFTRFTQEAYQRQERSQWCWAASISMLFSYYSHPVEQPRIVREVYGSDVNMPAQAGIVMARQLNRRWVDDHQVAFNSEVTGVYDYDAGVLSLTDQQMINELEQDHPLIIGARSHAMVLTMIRYYRTSQGPYIVEGGVFDPWPFIGARPLAPDELYPVHRGGSIRFVASVRVSEASGPPPQEGGRGCSTTGNAVHASYLVLIILSTAVLRRRSQS